MPLSSNSLPLSLSAPAEARQETEQWTERVQTTIQLLQLSLSLIQPLNHRVNSLGNRASSLLNFIS